jgi:hypothetical protein
MPNTPLKNRKLSPWVTEAVKHRRWLEDRLHPPFEVTAPRYSEEWMDEIVTRDWLELAEERYIEKLLRIERQRIIDKLLKDALRKEGE